MGLGVGGFLELLIAPPGGVLWFILAGVVLWRRRPHWGYGLVGAGAVLLFLASLPITAGALMGALEPYPALTAAQLDRPEAQAIVVLGAGRRKGAAEYGGDDTLNALALERVRYAAWLARRTGLPLLVSGGLAEDGQPAEANMMQQVLEQEFQQPVRWVEPRSRTTYENAEYSAAILKAAGVERIYLVTHAWHQPRALWSFHRFQLDVTPAPTAFDGLGHGPLELHDFLPSAKALQQTAFAFHELVGNVWYRARF